MNLMDFVTLFQVTTDSCLSVIAQTFMDSCSLNENILGKFSWREPLFNNNSQYKGALKYYKDMQLF